MKKNIIMLLVFSLIAVHFPTVMTFAAEEDVRKTITFELKKSTLNDVKAINGTDNKTAQFKQGRLSVKSEYSNIADGQTWMFGGVELKDNADRNYSEIKDYANLLYNVYTDKQTVTVDNLYFAATSSNGAVTGISAAAYSSDIKYGKANATDILVSLSEFTGSNAVEFISGKTFDASKFNGMGIIRKSAEGAASTGNFMFQELSVISIPAITNIESEVRSGIHISFDKPAITTIDKYEIVRTNGDTSTTFTLTSDDLILDNDKYYYVDTTAVSEVEYSYKVRIHDSEYNMYSPYSASVTEEIGEEDGGEELPSDGADTVYFDIHMAQCDWGSGASYSTPSTIGGAAMTNNVNASSIDGMGSSGKVQRFSLNPANFKEYSSYAEPGTWQQKVYRGYMAGVADYAESKGGDNNNEQTSYNISAVKDTGYAIFKVNIQGNVPLEQLYFTLSDAFAGNGNKHHDSRNYVGVPVSDYYTEADRGTTKYVAIPLTDFAMTNTRSFRSVRNNEWDSINNEDMETELLWKTFRGMGFLRRIRNGNNDESDAKFDIPEYTDGYIYCGEAMITNLAAPTDFKIYDVKENKVILKWEHTADAAVKYNIYRTEGDGERTFVAEATKNQYVDATALTAGVTYKYEIEAVDKYGTKSPIQSDSTLIRTVDHPRKFTAVTYESETTELAVNMSWEEAKFGDVKEYRLYRNDKLYRTFAPNERTFRDTDLVEHSDYTYTMTAVDTADLESIATNPVTVTASCVGRPTNLSYEVKNLNEVEMAWNAPDFADKYYIYLNGTKIAETANTDYTVEDVEYDEALIFGVRAVNAANATSNETQTEEFVIKNPKLTSSLVIFDDSLNSELTRTPMAGVTISETKAKSIIGEKSLVFDFSERKASTVTGTLAGTIDIKNYRDNGAHLGFWLWADKNADLSKLEIGVGMKGTVASTTTTMYASVKASDYVSANGKWVFVDIPLKDIPDMCSGTASGLTQTSTMDFEKITGYAIRYNNSQQETGPVIYIDHMTIDTGATWNVAGIKDNNGNEVSTELSAGAASLKIAFTEDMNAETLTANGIVLSYTDGETTKNVNTYGSYNSSTKTYTMSFLEQLKQNTEYTLSISGAATDLGMLGSYSKKFTTNSDEQSSGDYKIPDINAVMSHSTNGAVTTVTVSMPADRTETVKNYTLRLNYNSDIVRPNGDAAVTNVPNGAAVSKELGRIVVSGSMDGNTMSGTLMSVQFTTIKAGTVSASLSGTVEVYNAAADKTASASVNGQHSFTASTYKPQGGGSTGGGGGNSGAASRDNGKETVDKLPIEQESEVTGNADGFSDLETVPWAKEAIVHLAKKGHINGFDDGTYRPNDIITREQFAKMIVMVLGYNTYQYDLAEFDDVDNDAWFANYVTIAAKSGLVNGIDDNNFGTGMEITRQDMATIIYRAIKSDNIRVSELYSDIQFSDTASDYAQEAIRQLFRYGLMDGVGNNMFDPFGSVTRAMAAKVLYQLDLLL